MLELQKITCGYGKKQVLFDISFTVKTGEIVAVIGPNGSGKTTLLRTITKLVVPQEGKVILNGEDLGMMDNRKLAQSTAVVSQDQDTGELTVLEYVLLGRIPHYRTFQFFETKQDLAIAERYMALTDVLKYKDRMLAHMSGGERQLAHIARALIQEPTLLLLDEPTAYLDITHQVGVLNMIKRLNRELNVTVLMVLHDLNLAAEYADRLMLLNDGRIFKEGIPADVLTYQNIEEVYKTPVLVHENPISKRPYIMVVSERMKETV